MLPHFLVKFIALFVLFMGFVEGSEANSGTLIVSYQTNRSGQCLDRLRFWLINEQEERILYPKGDEFVDQHHNCMERTVAISRLPVGTYRVQFLVPNRDNRFEVPSTRLALIEAGKVFRIDQQIKFHQKPLDFVEIAAGEAIIGDPFSDNRTNERRAKKENIAAFAIAVFELTNSHYAEWLNLALYEGTVEMHPSRAGVVINKEGQLLCRTLEADGAAQITAEQVGDGASIHFRAVSGYENHPVIQVSWYGADAFCKDNECRLPTEAEWEKAAGMALASQDTPLRRYKYGFGQDQIDPTWANYNDKAEERRAPGIALTTAVGFYNGVERLKDGRTTHDAASPYGAYDMSGNVWEWVSDGNASNHKIVKGGCYTSLADGVRVSERLALPPDHADIYTGFRVAKEATAP